MTRALLRLVPIFAVVLLAACGGSSDSGGSIQPPAPGSLTIQPTQTSLGVNSLTDVVVTVNRPGSGLAPDGTMVSLSVTPPSLGQVGAASGEDQSFGNSATAVTAGGQARFRFKSTQATGTARITASANIADTPNTIRADADISLDGSPSTDTRLVIEADRDTIPVNTFGLPPACRDYPYQAEVTVTWRNLRGEMVTVPEDEEAMRASWNSLENVGAIGIPDDPETQDINECEVHFIGVGVTVNAGRGTLFVRSLGAAGTGTLTVSVRDLDTGEDLNATMDFTFSTGAPPVPANVIVVPESQAVYAQGSGGPTSQHINVFVDDGGGTPVPNPDGANNLRLEILNPEGERLSATDAGGQTQEGTTVDTRTFNGIAGAVFQAGSRQGTVTVRAIADRADNNVDNGIQDPVEGEATMTVSDGRLFSVTLTTPQLESLTVNRQDLLLPGDVSDDFEPPPDGTYSLLVGAIANDRLGNPVLPGTVLSFGMIDSPTTGFPDQGTGGFAIAGGDGNPEEGGYLFTAPGGAFTTAGGGAGPGDALVLFGREVSGNADLEGARVIQSVNSGTQLTVERRFNLNDHTGQSVNSGPVIPYAIGRAMYGNIGASASTDINGVATTQLNYPVSQLGRAAIVWAQGEGEVVAGEPKTVADVEPYAFYGLAPAELSVSPGSITANQNTSVLVCLTDARLQPLPGFTIGFAFEGLTSGTGTANGQSGSGTAGRTGVNGCVNVSVTTSGILADDSADPQLVFSAGGNSVGVDIVGGTEPPPPRETYLLNIVIDGAGSVIGVAPGSGFSPAPPGGSSTFTCPTQCQIEFFEGTRVNLTADPDPGSDFTDWTMDCSGSLPSFIVTMDGDRTCRATFTP